MDEFKLISKIRHWTHKGRGVMVGIGDDTAVMRSPQKNKDILFTTDMLVEGRHFRLTDATPYEIGRKALAVNLSDIAAMGGVPTHAVVAVGLPKKYTGRFAADLYRGLRDLARRFHVSIVGGDTNHSQKVILSVALLGEAEKGRAVKRSGAKTGDLVFVSGSLGGSYASRKHLNFIPRLKEGRYLAKNFRVHAMMDISDGLASDLHRIAEESRVGIEVEESWVPVSPSASGTRQALTEGEDFELLFTLSKNEAKRLPKNFKAIGRVMPRGYGVKLLKKNGTTASLRGGFDHFR